MSIYVRPTKQLALLTITVLVFAAATTFFVAFVLADAFGHEVLRRAGHSQQGEIK